MKHLLLTTIAAVVLVGCIGVSKTELLKDEDGNLIILPAEPAVATATPERLEHQFIVQLDKAKSDSLYSI